MKIISIEVYDQLQSEKQTLMLEEKRKMDLKELEDKLRQEAIENVEQEVRKVRNYFLLLIL